MVCPYHLQSQLPVHPVGTSATTASLTPDLHASILISSLMVSLVRQRNLSVRFSMNYLYQQTRSNVAQTCFLGLLISHQFRSVNNRLAGCFLLCRWVLEICPEAQKELVQIIQFIGLKCCKVSSAPFESCLCKKSLEKNSRWLEAYVQPRRLLKRLDNGPCPEKSIRGRLCLLETQWHSSTAHSVQLAHFPLILPNPT